MIEQELTGKIIKTFYKVYNTLGHGFLEKIYHKAMIIELVKAGLKVETEKPITVRYFEDIIGEFEADLIANEKIMLELKAKDALHEAHEAQLLNYLRATEIEIGLLLNFGKEPKFKRKFFSNSNKMFKKPDGSLLESLF
jgi:hypothetical protein